MSAQTIIDGYKARVFFQMEDAPGADSSRPVFAFEQLTRFAWQPVHDGGGSRVDVFRHMTGQRHTNKHYSGSFEVEYNNDLLLPLLLLTMFDLTGQEPNVPGPGMIRYTFRPRRRGEPSTFKLGLEYADSPYYILHGCAMDSIRLTVTARRITRVRFTFKALDHEIIPPEKEYRHPRLIIFGQLNFDIERIKGPCYDADRSGLSCRLEPLTPGRLLTESTEHVITEGGESGALIMEEGENWITEEGDRLVLESGEPQYNVLLEGGAGTDRRHLTGLDFTARFNGQLLETASEASFEATDPKQPNRYTREGKPTRHSFIGQPGAGGELALLFDDVTIPHTHLNDTEGALELKGVFDGDGRELLIEWPRIRFTAATPDGPTKRDLYYRASFEGMEDHGETASGSKLTLTV